VGVDTDVVVIGAGALGLSTALHCTLSARSRTTRWSPADSGSTATITTRPGPNRN